MIRFPRQAVPLFALVFLFFAGVSWLGLSGNLLIFTWVQLGIGLILLLFHFSVNGRSRHSKLLLQVSLRDHFHYVILLQGLGLFVLLSALNMFVASLGVRWDLTESKAFSLSSESQKILESISEPIELVAVQPTKHSDLRDIQNLFELYLENPSGRVSASFINPVTEPHRLESNGFRKGILLSVRVGERTQALTEISEQSISSAIFKLSRKSLSKAYWIDGFGGPDTSDSGPTGASKLLQTLSDAMFEVVSWSLAADGEIPDDAAMALLVGPKQEMTPEDTSKLVRYVQGGGSLLVMGDALGARSLNQVLLPFGMTLEPAIIIQELTTVGSTQNREAKLSARPIGKLQGKHPINGSFGAQDISLFSFASPIRIADSGLGSAVITSLIQTNSQTWIKKDIDSLLALSSQEPLTQQPGDMIGPFSLAMSFEGRIASSGESDTDKLSRLVVVGDGDWIRNATLDWYTNQDLFLNILSWLSGSDVCRSVPPRGLRESVAMITKDQYLLIFALCILIPQLIVLFGIFIWSRRRFRFLAGV